MLSGQSILVIGARSGGYGASIASAAIGAGARVFGTSLNPDDQREQDFFQELGISLIDVPLRFHADHRDNVFQALAQIEQSLRERGVNHLDAVIHCAAGGFPRQPSVMKAVADVLKGKQTFFDLATPVKRNVYYVNASSFEDTINGLAGLTDNRTRCVALTYRGDLPYFIAHTKKHLENLAARMARSGKNTLIAAFPEAWTQSSQFFTGIEIAVFSNYLRGLRGRSEVSTDLAAAYAKMEESLSQLDGLDALIADMGTFLDHEWNRQALSCNSAELFRVVQKLFDGLRKTNSFSTLRRSVEIISDFVRKACGVILVREFLSGGRYEPGDVRQIFYRDLLGTTSIGLAKPQEKTTSAPLIKRYWKHFEKDEIRKTLSMYGKNFLFLDRVVMEAGELRDGMMGFGRFTVPSPAENPILKDHFVGMPLFGGHLQMEAVAQFGTFMIMQLLKNQRMVPILTGTEFPDLNTLAPPGETLTMVGAIRLCDKRDLRIEAFIENRYARSKGIIRGMVLNERVVRKMMASFASDNDQ